MTGLFLQSSPLPERDIPQLPADCSLLTLEIENQSIRFRLRKKEDQFRAIESRLILRNPNRFTGYSDLRSQMEPVANPDELKEKLEALVDAQSWPKALAKVLFSVESEVIMDLSYPDPVALHLYNEAMKRGIEVQFFTQSAWGELFVKMLLQKNSFDQQGEVVTAPDVKEENACFYGTTISEFKGVKITPTKVPMIEAEADHLSESLLGGIEEEFMLAAHFTDADSSTVRLASGLSQLIISSLLNENYAAEAVQLFKKLSLHSPQYGEKLVSNWSWLNEVKKAESNHFRLPSPYPPLTEPFEDCVFNQLKILAAKDPEQQLIQMILHRVLAFSNATRGLRLESPIRQIVKHWHNTALAPRDEEVGLLCGQGLIIQDWKKAGFRPKAWFSVIKEGDWPSRAWMECPAILKPLLGLLAPKRVRTIRESFERFNSAS